MCSERRVVVVRAWLCACCSLRLFFATGVRRAKNVAQAYISQYPTTTKGKSALKPNSEPNCTTAALYNAYAVGRNWNQTGTKMLPFSNLFNVVMRTITEHVPCRIPISRSSTVWPIRCLRSAKKILKSVVFMLSLFNAVDGYVHVHFPVHHTYYWPLFRSTQAVLQWSSMRRILSNYLWPPLTSNFGIFVVVLCSCDI